MALNNKPSRTVNKFHDAIAQGRRGRKNLSGHGNISDRKVVGAHAGVGRYRCRNQQEVGGQHDAAAHNAAQPNHRRYFEQIMGGTNGRK
jgi:hypothetical protein